MKLSAGAKRARALATGMLLLLGACSTRFVDLEIPDAGPGPGQPAVLKCESLKRADGSECKICYAADGTLVNGACSPATPPPVPPADSGAAVSCKVAPAADSRCLYCAGSTGEYTACLKCEAPVKTGNTGEVCRTCYWGDQIGGCLQCFAANGAATHDDCDALRSESFPRTDVKP